MLSGLWVSTVSLRPRMVFAGHIRDSAIGTHIIMNLGKPPVGCGMLEAPILRKANLELSEVQTHKSSVDSSSG